MRKIAGLLVLSFGFAACQQAPEPEEPTVVRTQAVRCGTLIDGFSDEPLGARLIIITGNRISAVLPGDALGLFGRRRDLARRNGNSRGPEQLLGLVFVKIH